MTAAIIECILKRKNGTYVELGGKTYHFAPRTSDPMSPHIAAVSDKFHIQRFLSISEAYQLHSMEAAPAPIGLTPAPAAQTAPASPAQAAPAAPAAITLPDPETGAATVTAAQTAPLEPVAPVVTPEPAAQTAEDLEKMDIEAIRDIFRAEVGREPNPRAKAETMAAAIMAKRSENA